MSKLWPNLFITLAQVRKPSNLSFWQVDTQTDRHADTDTQTQIHIQTKCHHDAQHNYKKCETQHKLKTFSIQRHSE
jgi:hypothetical protein